MFYINVWLTVKDPQQVGTVRDLLRQAAASSRTEQGCARFEVYHSEADPTRFLLTERWESRTAWEDHKGREAFTEIYKPKVLPLVEREPHISVLVE